MGVLMMSFIRGWLGNKTYIFLKALGLVSPDLNALKPEEK